MSLWPKVWSCHEIVNLLQTALKKSFILCPKANDIFYDLYPKQAPDGVLIPTRCWLGLAPIVIPAQSRPRHLSKTCLSLNLSTGCDEKIWQLLPGRELISKLSSWLNNWYGKSWIRPFTEVSLSKRALGQCLAQSCPRSFPQGIVLSLSCFTPPNSSLTCQIYCNLSALLARLPKDTLLSVKINVFCKVLQICTGLADHVLINGAVIGRCSYEFSCSDAFISL